MAFSEDLILQQLGLAGTNRNSATKAQSNERAKQSENCETPQSVARLIMSGDEIALAKCFERNSYTSKERIEIASELMQLFKSHGVMIRPGSVSDDPNFKDPDTRQHKYVWSSSFKEIYIKKIGDDWIFIDKVLARISEYVSKSQWLSLKSFYERIPNWATENLWGIEGISIIQFALLGLIVLIGMALRLIVVSTVSRQVARWFVRLGMHQFEELTKKASMPLGNLILIALVALFVPVLEFNISVAYYLLMTLRLGAGVSVVLLAYRAVDVFAFFMQQRAERTESKLDDQLVPLFRKGVKIVIVIMGGIFILQNLQIDVTSLLAGVTIGGLAFSFAARDTVANLFGSITIFADKPFLVGDWIKAAGVEGIVEQVGFRSTRIRTFYNSLVSVPNSKFTDSVVDNMGARKYRRTFTEIGITYATTPEQIEAFCNGIRAIIKSHPLTRKDYFEIHFSGYGDFSLKIMLYFFLEVKTFGDELRGRHEVFLDIFRLAKEMRVDFAFPTQTLHIETMAIARERTSRPMPTVEELKQAARYFSPEGEGAIPPGPRMGPGYFATDQ